MKITIIIMNFTKETRLETGFLHNINAFKSFPKIFCILWPLLVRVVNSVSTCHLIQVKPFTYFCNVFLFCTPVENRDTGAQIPVGNAI